MAIAAASLTGGRRRPGAAAVLLLAGALGALGGCSGARGPAATGPRRPAGVTATVTPRALGHLPARGARVWAVGDGADGGPAARALAAVVRRARPDLFLYLGDVYETGSASEFRSAYDRVYGALRARTAPTPGNHDWPRRATGYGPYWRTALGAPLPAWYAVHTAGWTILSLSSEAPHDARSPQLAWLRARLRRAGTCRIAFWHRPRSSAGLHGDQPDVGPLWDAVRGRVALVLNGHDHTSQRLKPVGATTEIVAGGGGHRPYPLAVGDARLAYGSTGPPTALRLRLRPGRADVAFVRADGAVVDRRAIACRPGA